MPNLNFIAIHIGESSRPCLLCGETKIEWSASMLESAWLCFECDLNLD
jgi:formylmethanofuran dehydrogenase subunit E